jgi:hypothetical protein
VPIAKESQEVNNALNTLSEKYLPTKSPSPAVYVAQEEYRSIFPQLEVWDKQTQDPDTQERVHFIYDTLKDIGNPKDKIVSILTTLGATPQGDTKLNRVYRYLKLFKEADKTKRYYYTITDEMKAIRGGR